MLSLQSIPEHSQAVNMKIMELKPTQQGFQIKEDKKFGAISQRKYTEKNTHEGFHSFAVL